MGSEARNGLLGSSVGASAAHRSGQFLTQARKGRLGTRPPPPFVSVLTLVGLLAHPGPEAVSGAPRSRRRPRVLSTGSTGKN